MNKESFRHELEDLINKHNMENSSDTPDFMLADYLINCLETFGEIVKRRDKWYDTGNESNANPPLTSVNKRV